MSILNEALAKKQKITEKQRKNLLMLYKDLKELFDEANNDENLDKNGPAYSDMLRELEFSLQDNWNFDRDELKHTWWNRFNKCTCPKMDNAERFGFPKYISGDCPFHGGDWDKH